MVAKIAKTIKGMVIKDFRANGVLFCGSSSWKTLRTLNGTYKSSHYRGHEATTHNI
jgi:hypothetical protein